MADHRIARLTVRIPRAALSGTPAHAGAEIARAAGAALAAAQRPASRTRLDVRVASGAPASELAARVAAAVTEALR